MISDDRNSYGGFLIRFAAYMVDFVVLLIPTLLISDLYRVATPVANREEEVAVQFFDGCISLIVNWVYFAAFWSSRWQATIGKKVCGLRVVDSVGNRISFGRATGRYFAGFLSAVLLCIGFIMIAWTRKRQGLHDFIAETFVVKDAA